MPTPFETAQLNLKLFELRRDPLLREARAWFLNEFHPNSFEEVLAFTGGERNAFARMVMSYWEMAASLVVFGAIDREAFLAANGEIVGTYALIQPFLPQLREYVSEPTFCSNIETVVMAMPDAQATLDRRRAMLRGAAEARRKAAGE